MYIYILFSIKYGLAISVFSVTMFLTKLVHVFIKINKSRNIYKILHLNEQILKANLTFD